jgi:hypothetical protein
MQGLVSRDAKSGGRTGSGAEASLGRSEGRIGGLSRAPSHTRWLERGQNARNRQCHADFPQQRAAFENPLVCLTPRLGGFLKVVGKVFSEEIHSLRLGRILGRPLTLGYELFFNELRIRPRDKI